MIIFEGILHQPRRCLPCQQGQSRAAQREVPKQARHTNEGAPTDADERAVACTRERGGERYFCKISKGKKEGEDEDEEADAEADYSNAISLLRQITCPNPCVTVHPWLAAFFDAPMGNGPSIFMCCNLTTHKYQPLRASLQPKPVESRTRRASRKPSTSRPLARA